MHNQNFLLELVRYKMPFGKYKGQLIRELPVNYLEWFSAKGFPDGKLGQMLSTMHEIRQHDLMYLLKPLL